ncbi:MAG TPA: hypothetical protein VGQ65_18735 [Thermoanaerobaculia bacterium]|jgi:hypothetical protein|nr:hypothetical protein [Thermoanaerobaculia bacterium]
MNTRVEYRDGSNYKQWGAVVFRGECDASLAGRLFEAVDRGEFFIADQVRLPELFFADRPLYADDHCWHEMREVTTSSAVADDLHARTIEEFVAEMERASTEGWVVFDRSERRFGS